MRRSLVLGLVVITVLGAAFAARADQTATGLIPRPMAEKSGLTRAWFAQVDMNVGSARVTNVTLFPGIVLAETDQGTVHALDSETGRTLWAQQFGQRDWPTMPAAANKDYVAVVNGSTIYLVDRTSGDLKWSHPLGGAPSAGVALTDAAAYIPLRKGAVEMFAAKSVQQFPKSYSSSGVCEVQPIVTPDSVAWPTDRGFLYVVPFGGQAPRFHIGVRGAIVCAPSYQTPNLYAGTVEGFVYCIDEYRGQLRWRFLSGDSIRQTPVVAKDAVYAVTERSGMFRVNTDTGLEVWWTPGIKRFLATSPNRVYATDNLGRLTVLDAQTGSVISTLPMNGYNVSPMNTRNDRIVLATDTGLIQMLHETALEQPVENVVPRPIPKSDQKPAEGETNPDAAADADAAPK